MDGLQQSNPNWCWLIAHYALTVGMPSCRIPPLALGISRLNTGPGLVGAAEQLLAHPQPVLGQILWQFIHCHAIDPGTAPVLSHPRQRYPDIAARDHP